MSAFVNSSDGGGGGGSAAPPIQLTIVRKVKAIPDGDFVVKDADGKILLKLKNQTNHNFSRDHKILLDRAGHAIFTLKRKVMTAHKRWQVYRGESDELIFSAKSHSMLYLKAKLDVFLATNNTNTNNKVCDFLVRGSYADRSTIVYSGAQEYPPKIVAQMHDRRHVAPNLLLGREDCELTVSPDVDYASMVALILILDDIDNEGKDYATGVSHASLPIILLS